MNTLKPNESVTKKRIALAWPSFIEVLWKNRRKNQALKFFSIFFKNRVFSTKWDIFINKNFLEIKFAEPCAAAIPRGTEDRRARAKRGGGSEGTLSICLGSHLQIRFRESIY